MGRTACTEPQCLYKGALYLNFYFTDMYIIMFLNTQAASPISLVQLCTSQLQNFYS